MQVVTADNNSAGHLGGDNTASKDATTDRNLTSERTLLVCTLYHLWAIPTELENTRTDISSIYRLGGCLEPKAHILIPPFFLRRHLFSTYPSHTFSSQTCLRVLSSGT